MQAGSRFNDQRKVPSSREQALDPLEVCFVRHLRSGTGASLSEQASPLADAPLCDDVTTGGDTASLRLLRASSRVYSAKSWTVLARGCRGIAWICPENPCSGYFRGIYRNRNIRYIHRITGWRLVK